MGRGMVNNEEYWLIQRKGTVFRILRFRLRFYLFDLPDQDLGKGSGKLQNRIDALRLRCCFTLHYFLPYLHYVHHIHPMDRSTVLVVHVVNVCQGSLSLPKLLVRGHT